MAEKEEIGDFSLLAEGGTIAPHISFSLAREKEMWSAAVQRKRERGAAFVAICSL
ncbi:hypothetical protein LI073_08050 [bacterium 210917-SL.2.15]|nr:hypothetical protein [bacterium 210917-SL.2.15]